jgi:hypothetical protein
MYSSIALLAMILPVANEPSVSWQNNYRIAKAAAVSKQKPLALFLAPGKDGWKKLLSEGAFSAEIQRLLAENYVAVFIDQDSDYGKKITELFGVEGQTALFISSRDGDLQAFRHDGTLSESDLAVALNRYSAATHVVVTTENLDIATSRATSSYSSPAPVYQNYFNPYCPNCRQQ